MLGRTKDLLKLPQKEKTFFEIVSLCVQAGVQQHNFGSQQPPYPGLSDSLALASQVGRTTGAHHHAQLSFVFFNRDGVLPNWPGWS